MGDTPAARNAAGPIVGTVAWRDLTVGNAEALRDFYSRVVGWQAAPVDVEGYSDFVMMPPESAEPVAGICHARGPNADLPAQWLLYIVVEDLDRSTASCLDLGGAVVAGPRPLSGGRFCVIRDPAGAVCALFQPGS
jgi:predicted enzyme related to lactoylglutathione lyase